jgi:hypothetical protein
VWHWLVVLRTGRWYGISPQHIDTAAQQFINNPKRLLFHLQKSELQMLIEARVERSAVRGGWSRREDALWIGETEPTTDSKAPAKVAVAAPTVVPVPAVAAINGPLNDDEKKYPRDTSTSNNESKTMAVVISTEPRSAVLEPADPPDDDTERKSNRRTTTSTETSEANLRRRAQMDRQELERRLGPPDPSLSPMWFTQVRPTGARPGRRDATGNEVVDVYWVTRSHQWGLFSYIAPFIFSFHSLNAGVLATAGSAIARIATYEVLITICHQIRLRMQANSF